MASGDSEVKTLLNFVSLASSDIKAALDRSAPCRRSVDHRKYLQKQLRRFSHRCPALRSTHTARHTASAATAVAGRHEREGASSEDGTRPGHLPMRKRQLPASFWKEPQSSSAGLEQLLKSSASGTVHGDRRKAVFDEFRASPLLSGSADPPPRRSVACVCPCACCPLQYGRFLLQHGHSHTDTPFRSKTGESGVDISHRLLDGLHGSGAHVVIKPIPTKPVSSSIFSVFGFI